VKLNNKFFRASGTMLFFFLFVWGREAPDGARSTFEGNGFDRCVGRPKARRDDALHGSIFASRSRGLSFKIRGGPKFDPLNKDRRPGIAAGEEPRAG